MTLIRRGARKHTPGAPASLGDGPRIRSRPGDGLPRRHWRGRRWRTPRPSDDTEEHARLDDRALREMAISGWARPRHGRMPTPTRAVGVSSFARATMGCEPRVLGGRYRLLNKHWRRRHGQCVEAEGQLLERAVAPERIGCRLSAAARPRREPGQARREASAWPG